MDKTAAIKVERHKLVLHVERVLEGPMVFLGFVWLALLVLEMIRGLSPVLEFLSMAIWIVFIVDFLLKFILAPVKGKFLKRNWLTILSLVIPALRILRFARVFRVIRGLKSVRLVKVVGSLNRGMKSLGATIQRRGLKYVVALTLVVIFAGGAGMYAFERQFGLKTYADALWWTAMLLTSIGSEYWPQTGEGKALCLLLSIYGFCVFGYITATLASFFVGRDAEEADAPIASTADVKSLQNEIQKLARAVQDLRSNKS